MYKVGDEVAYGLHGKCVITGIATKDLATGPVSFYQIKTVKNPIIPRPANPNDPAILVPVESAAINGMRPLMSKEQAEEALKILADQDYHFDMNTTWVTKQKKLEETIRKEGFTGLAKVVGHMYVLTKKDAAPPSNITKFYDSVFRIFLRELADTMGLTGKDMEPIVLKALKTKMSLDH